jgi:acetone carboxylase gamma subunit
VPGEHLEAKAMLRAELYCYFCGHGSGEVLVATKSRRPTPEQLRAAYSHVTGPRTPQWNAGEQPLCPRCGGQLFLEKYEQQVVRRRAVLKEAS